MDGSRDRPQDWDLEPERLAEEFDWLAATRREASVAQADGVLWMIRDLVDLAEPLRPALAVVLPDLEQDAGDFGALLRFAEARGHPIPCLAIGDVPIPVAAVRADDQSHEDDVDQAYEAALEDVRASGRESDIDTVLVAPREARDHFLRRVRDFAAARFVLHPADSGQQPVQFPFRVVTQRSGWRVRRCGAYLAKTNATIFGAPTTPLTGRITAGRFIFGLDAAGERLRWDKGEFDVPPSVEAVLVVG